MYFKEVRDAELWRKIQISMMEAMVIFVFTISIGILNAVDAVDFTRAELLFHLHSGVIGWISLSSVAILIWYFVGERDLDESSLSMAKNLLKYVQIVVPIYVSFFYLGFTLSADEKLLRFIPQLPDGKGWFILLAIGAIAMSGGFLWTLYFGVIELGKVNMKTTSHYLFLGAMLTSTYGGIFGMVLELQNLIGESFFDIDAGQDGTAAHAAAMEAGYLYMMIAGIMEWQIFGKEQGQITKGGWAQVLTLFFAGFTVSIGAGFNILAIVQLNLPLLLIGFGLLVARVFVKINPRSIIETEPDRFFLPAALGMFYSVFFFLYVVSQIIGGKDITDFFASPWFVGLALANNHSLFVGAMTGMIFTMLLVMFKDEDKVNKTLENIGFALMYVGLLGFMLVLIIRGNAQENGDTDLSDLRTDIASIMGIGLLLLIWTIFSRYRASTSNSS